MLKDNYEKVYMKNRKEWRNWLKRNHSHIPGIWLVYYKKHTKQESIVYKDAVEEALCYGWIDSTVKKIDDNRYCQKFTPRSDKSVWSDLNKKRVEKLIKSKKMTKFGLEKINIAKQNGMWYKYYPDNKNNPMPEEFNSELKRNKKAKSIFEDLSPSQKKAYINWIYTAKRVETRIKRSKEAISILLDKKVLGMK